MTRPSRITQITLLCMGLWLIQGCAGTRHYRARMVERGGIQMALTRAKSTARTVRLELLLRNNTSSVLLLDNSKIAFISQAGKTYYGMSKKKAAGALPGRQLRVSVLIRDRSAMFKKMIGAFVRVDGAFLNEQQVFLPPLLLGNIQGEPAPSPKTDPSSAVMALLKKASNKNKSVSVLDRILGRRGTKRAGNQAYKGVRRKIRTPVKCAVLPVRSSNISEDVVFVINEILLTEVQRAGFEAIGQEDISALIGFEKMRDDLGCDDASCMAEIGNALGVKYILRGSVAPLGKGTMFSVNLINTEGAKVLARANRIAKGGVEDIPQTIAEAIQELVQTSKL